MDSPKKPTIRDVAAASQVSVATISRYLTGSLPVSAMAAERIQRAIDALQYTPDRIAQGLKTRRMNQIMHVVPDITNPYYARMYRHVQTLAAERGYTVMLFDTAEQEKNEMRAVELFAQRDADGLIFCTIGRSEGALRRLKEIGRPTVLTSRVDELHFDTLYSPGGHGIYLAAQHLLELGHHDIAYVGGPSDSIINIRRKSGFMKAMQEAGAACSPDHMFEMDFSMESGYRAGVYLLGIGKRPTAICCANDMLAMGVMQALHERGVRIPEDISLTGEDDIEYVRVCRPSLTTIRNPSGFVAEHAVRMLIERIEGRYEGEPREVVCGRELVVRQSTCAPQPSA